MALTLVIIVRSERMSHSEPRKPLNFPQKKKSRTEQNEGLKKGRRKGKRTDGEKKRSDKRVCQMRKGGEMKKGLCVSRRCSSDFLKSPFCGSCTSAPFQPRLLLALANNKHRRRAGLVLRQLPEVFHMAGAFEFSRPEMNPSRCQPLCWESGLRKNPMLVSVCCS